MVFKKKAIIAVVAMILILFIGIVFYYRYFGKHQREFKIIFFDIGQGDAALIQFNNGQKMLVDCGPDRKILSKLGRTLPFYDRTIDFLLVTHPDLDHYGGCADILRRYKINTIIINGKEKFDSYFKIWDRAMRNEGAEIKIIKTAEEWLVASATLEFMVPDSSLEADAENAEGNNASIVFRLINEHKKYLFTGDIEEPLEKALILKYCLSASDCPKLKSDILKVGHHGSDSSSSEEFINAVSPSKAILSVGKNKFGHPSLRVLRRFERAGVDSLRTDELGDIVENQ
ncbi:MAG: MBL fold metallo-hydrolase [Patescibacteria group bacterium]